MNKKHSFKKYFIICLTIIFALSLTSAAFAKQPVKPGFKPWKENKKTSLPTKSWNVSFNMALLEETINENSIYITDINNQRLDTIISLSADCKTITITSSSPYQMEGEYRIYITSDVKSKQGDSLKEPIVVPFKVTNLTGGDHLVEIDYIYSKYFTKLAVSASKDVFSVKVNNLPMRYLGNDCYELGIAALAENQTIKIQAFDSKGKLLEEKEVLVK